MVRDSTVSVARHEKDLYLRPQFFQTLRQFYAAHPRHDHVCQHQVNRFLVFPAHMKGILTVPGAQDLVPVLLQGLECQIPDHVVIFNHQDGFRTLKGYSLFLCFPNDTNRLFYPGEVDFEGAPFARLTVDPDVAFTLLDDPVHGGEPQTRSFPLLLGGEKGLKETILYLLRHSDARVAHG